MSAVKLKRRPPLTTLATRLIVTRRSMYGVLSWAPPPRPPPSRRSRRSRLLLSLPPPGPLPLFGPPPSRRARPGIRGSLQCSRVSSSELQASLAGGVRQRRDTAVVGQAAPVEHDRGHAGLLGAGGDQLAD